MPHSFYRNYSLCFFLAFKLFKGLFWPRGSRGFLYIVYYTLYIHHTLHIIYYILYIVHCTLYFVRCTLYVVCCKLYVVRCTLYVIRCTLYVVHWLTKHQRPIVHCTLAHKTQTSNRHRQQPNSQRKIAKITGRQKYI